ncbi:uncharacterized protein IL334_003306 [Kwoniella shivajii]|uniref:Transcription factor IIIC 90kDa subunit N-terminal domain-containing protein n=1 Tax=Kwoniella shivajii TaxID=564305 RepID=A0ABZ1D065_9TREE|nr:hypothetical protein IL334_003306 [Kwoniella shivajii]
MTGDFDENPPTVLASRNFPGIIPSTSHHNVSWSDDGQCLFITRKGVNIVTPHLTTTLPPPTTLVDPTSSLDNPTAAINESKRRAALQAEADSEDEGLDTFEDTAIPSEKKGKWRMRRPNNGEIRFWSTGIEIDKDGSREDVYGWSDIGDEITAVYTEKEVTTRQAIWSPSGLSDLGGCLLVVLNSAMQVSVYAPRNDPYTKQWDELADLTMLTKGLLSQEAINAEMSVESMLESRTTCVRWSSHIPLRSMSGVDGSLLAMSNRAGKVAFWTYGTEKRFHRAHYFDVCEIGGWVADMAWSEWKEIEEQTYEVHLALALTDGSIRVMTLQRSVQQDVSGIQKWDIDVQPSVIIDRGDKRNISSIEWINDVLIWTKSGSVHILAGEGNQTVQWKGTISLKLERVGNWASANGLGPCIGVHRMNHNTILIVLSSLTAHLITNFTTSPILADPRDSLRTALAMRDAFEDHLSTDSLIKTRFRSVEIKPEAWTADTSGWTNLGWGGIGTWVTEPVNFHSLDSATEGKRSMNLVVANLGGSCPSPDLSVIDALRSILGNPPSLLFTSSGRLLMPYLLHIITLRQPESQAEHFLNLVKSDTDASSFVEPKGRELIEGFWGGIDLDRMRLKFVLASWCAATYPSFAIQFEETMAIISKTIVSYLIATLLQWTDSLSQLSNLSPIDQQFLTQLLKAARDVPSEDNEMQLAPLAANLARSLNQDGAIGGLEESEERCPACKTEVGPEGTCAKGHVWSRCSITHLLITHPHYRVCSTCPAISLLPQRHLQTPISVDREGKDQDWARFVPIEGGEDSLIQVALEAAIGCPSCGGRWQRAV